MEIRIALACAACLLCFPIPLIADDRPPASLLTELKRAANWENDQLRLAAYDQALEQFGLRHRSDDNAGFPNWVASESQDPLTDEILCFFSTRAVDAGYLDDKSLCIRVTGEWAELFVVWGEDLGTDSDDYKVKCKRVTYRVGRSAARENYWSNSTDGKATFYPLSVSDLIKELWTADRFVVRCTPQYKSPKTYVFNVSGLRQVMSAHYPSLDPSFEDASTEEDEASSAADEDDGAAQDEDLGSGDEEASEGE